MNIGTIFNAISLSSIYSSYGPPQQRDKESRRLRKFRAWLYRREENQREEIAELSALVADAELNALLEQERIARLQAQVATLERIITAATEQCGHVGDSAKPYMNGLKSWQIAGNTAQITTTEADE